MNELLPCPFCGGKAELNFGVFGERFVTCADDKCGGRLGCGAWHKEAEAAIAAWNRRAPDLEGLAKEIEKLDGVPYCITKAATLVREWGKMQHHKHVSLPNDSDGNDGGGWK